MSADSFAGASSGVAARTRQQARQELQQRETESEAAATYALSSQYIDPDELRELQRRPAVSFVVRNAASKQDEIFGASQAQARVIDTQMSPHPPMVSVSKPRQSWNSPIHVPLSHRKLVSTPAVFDSITPVRPPEARKNLVGTDRKSQMQATAKAQPRLASIGAPRSNQKPSYKEKLADRTLMTSLREKNKEIYDRLVKRFRHLHQTSKVTAGLAESQDPRTQTSSPKSVEDAILFFLNEKHKRDILYFKRKSMARVGNQPESSATLAPLISDKSSRYMPYDLERIQGSLKTGTGDYYIMSSSSLVHHVNSGESEIVGEAIPISQWVMESKMFSLLLAGIPLFQKFLVRRVFALWIREVRRLIYSDLRKRIADSLPLARKAFVLPMLKSCYTLHRIQKIRALGLPPKKIGAVMLPAVQEFHKELITVTESKLIDAKEELLGWTDSMVQAIQQDLDPRSNLDELYNNEANIIHTTNPKWKSAPIAALRMRKSDIRRQKETAKLDMILLEKYIRLIAYMFTESVYIMIVGCVHHLALELSAEENNGVICASVVITGDALILSPSTKEMKDVLLEGVAKLIRLASNFHFTKNAMAWSNNRGTGALAAIASYFACGTTSMQFDLQKVLRQDPQFEQATHQLLQEMTRWFDEAVHQMVSFESLKPIHAAVYSVKTNSISLAPNNATLHQSQQLQQAQSITVDISRITGISGMELGRYLKNLAHKCSILDRSQHGCQKIQSSWKVGFLEIQCRRSITDILEMIVYERDHLHQTIYELTTRGVAECITALQSATLVYEDRPQLIEFFCEQMKQVHILKDGERQLLQDIRNVDESMRALKRYAPPLAAQAMVQYNVLHNLFSKYSSNVQSHGKYAAKMLPSITQQVNAALQKHTLRCQRLLRIYEEYSGIATEEELQKHITMFHDVSRELQEIEDATRLYQEYQRMVGIKITDISILSDTVSKWSEINDIVQFATQWRDITSTMENGIFSEQKWYNHVSVISSFVPRAQDLQQSKDPSAFAQKLIQNMSTVISEYLHKLDLVVELAHPCMKLHHWRQVLELLGISTYVTTAGGLVSDGSSVTLGFLQSRGLAEFEPQVREIAKKAQNDAITEKKLDEMKNRLVHVALPLVRINDSYELDCPIAVQLLGMFEDDLLTIQTLTQVTSSPALYSSLVQWGEDIRTFQDILGRWISIQTDWAKLSVIFGLHNVQESVATATFEFQAMNRKWKAMMNAARSASSLAVCLSEVISPVFLNSSREVFDKLWRQLGNYLHDKRQHFPRFYFVSDGDLLHLIACSRDHAKLSECVSKCFRQIQSLDIDMIESEWQPLDHPPLSRPFSPGDDSNLIERRDEFLIREDPAACNVFEINAVCGYIVGEVMQVKSLRAVGSPEVWMKKLSSRIHESVKNHVCKAMDGTIVGVFEDHFEGLRKSLYASTKDPRPDSASIASLDHNVESAMNWTNIPLQVIMLCMNLFITSELAPLIHRDRTSDAWSTFWKGFQSKKGNLIDLIKFRYSSHRDRMVSSNLLTLLLNKTHGINELCDEETLDSTMVTNSASSEASNDATSYSYSYANGDSFVWTKMMRFYFDPFEKKCIVHQSVKSFEYGYAYVGNYSCPVLSPLCDRVILAINASLALGIGSILHGPTAGRHNTGKRTLVNELAVAVGVENIHYECSIALNYIQLKRMVRGVIQSSSCWLVSSGLEVATSNACMARVFAQEMNRLKDALRGEQEVYSMEGEMIPILNPKVAMFVTCSLDYERPGTQEFFLRMSCSFMPVACIQPDSRLVTETVLMASGLSDWKMISKKLHALLLMLENDPIPYADVPLSNVRSLVPLLKAISRQHTTNSWKSEERCAVVALWEELHSKILPDRRPAFLKSARSVFPGAEDLQFKISGATAIKDATTERRPTTQNKIGGSTLDQSHEVKSAFEYDSDEEVAIHDLQQLMLLLQASMASKKLIPCDSFLRKLVELYYVVSKNVVTVIAGRSGCGKSSAISILGDAFSSQPMNMIHDPTNHAAPHPVKITRLFPSAVSLEDIYGHFQDDTNVWADGFLSHFFRQNCEIWEVEPTNSDDENLPRKGSISSRSRRKSFVLAKGKQPYSSVFSPAAWMILDGVADPCSIVEPLRNLAGVLPDQVKKIILPNGDQLHCKNETLRVFFEVDSLCDWTPCTLSRFGIVYLQADLVLPYTLLIKNWMQQEYEPNQLSVFNFAGKVIRSRCSYLIDIGKRYVKFCDFSASLIITNILQLLNHLFDNYVRDETTNEWKDEVAIIVGYASIMTLGLLLQEDGRAEFHHSTLEAFPEMAKLYCHLFEQSSCTVFDIGLQFTSSHRVKLFRWNPLAEAGIDLLEKRASMSAIDFATQVDNSMANWAGNPSFTSSLHWSSIFIPTVQSVSCEAWLVILARANINVLMYGDASVGKTRILTNVMNYLNKRDRTDTKLLQINKMTKAMDIQNAIEWGLPHKLRGKYCPNSGAKAFMLLLDNLNLEVEVQHRSGTSRQCSEMIRQISDTRGSFLHTTQEFVEFKDLLIWCSFSLSTFGYIRPSLRLLRHFHLIWLPDHSNQVCQRILEIFPDQFLSLYSCDMELADQLGRVCQMPVEFFSVVRRRFKPTALAPHTLFSVVDIVKTFASIIKMSKSITENVSDLELAALHSVLKVCRNRILKIDEVNKLQRIGKSIARRLNFSVQSLDYINNYEEHLYADYDDTEGYSTITYRAATALFTTGDERFHWYQNAGVKESSLPAQDVTDSSMVRTASTKKSVSMAPLISRNSTAFDHDQLKSSQTRRSSLSMAALKSSSSERTTAPTTYMIYNMLDVYGYLQEGSHQLLLYGSESSCHRITTMVACGVLALQFKELVSEATMSEYLEHFKQAIIDVGLRATNTLIYVECDDLSDEELNLTLRVLVEHDLPLNCYSTAERAQLLSLDHQSRAHHVATPSSAINAGTVAPPLVGGTTHHQHSSSTYHENLQKCLYIGLSFSKNKTLLELLYRQPSIFYQSAMKTFHPWSDNTFADVYCASLGAWSPLLHALANPKYPDSKVSEILFQQWLISIDRIANDFDIIDAPRSSTLARKFSALRSRFEEYLRMFKLLFTFQKQKNDELRRRLRDVLKQLENEDFHATSQLSREENSESLLEDAHMAVKESALRLQETEAIEREAKRAFLLDEQRCSVLQTDIEHERDIIQQELAEILPDLVQANDSLSQINKYHITEMKSFTNPPQLVRLAMQAVCVLLGAPPTWPEALRILADIRFLDRLRNFDKDHVDPTLIERVKYYVNHPDFSMENMKRASLASTTLCKWVLAIMRYFEVMKSVAPTRKKLMETEQHFMVIDETVKSEKQKLIDLELRLNELRDAHLRNLQWEEDLQRSHDTRLRWRSELTDFARVIIEWVGILQKRKRKLKRICSKLPFDCAIVSAVLIYASDKSFEDRLKLVHKWKQSALHIFGEFSDAFLHSFCGFEARKHCEMSTSAVMNVILKHWVISGISFTTVDLKKALITMKDLQDIPFTSNLFLFDQIQNVCFKYPLLFDPLGVATSWLKQKCNLASNFPSAAELGIDRDSALQDGGYVDDSMTVIDAGDPHLISKIEKRVTQKGSLVILVENIFECECSTFNAVLELLALVKKKSDNTVFFATKSLAKASQWKPKIWSKIAVIDFSPTNEDLNNRFIAMFYDINERGSGLHQKWELHRQELISERLKEQHLFNTFLDHFSTDIQKQETSSNVQLGRHASVPDEHIEYQMERLAKHLAEYSAAIIYRKKVQKDFQHILELRTEAHPFALRGQTFVRAETLLENVQPSLSLSVAQSIECYKECYEQTTNASNEFECHDNPLSKEMIVELTEDVTLMYLRKRLNGLPANYSCIFELLVAICIADSEDMVYSTILRSLLSEKVVQHMAKEASTLRQAISDNEGAVDSIHGCIKQMAAQIVSCTISAALMRVTTPRAQIFLADGISSSHELEPVLDNELLPVFDLIQKAFTEQMTSDVIHKKFYLHLKDDMIQQTATWKKYLQLRGGNRSNAMQELLKSQYPPWIQNSLNPLEKMMVHLCLFESVPTDMIDQVLVEYLGIDVIERLRNHENSAQNLSIIARRTAFSTPLLVLSDPSTHVAVPYQNIMQYARTGAVRDEVAVDLSMGDASGELRLTNKLDTIEHLAMSGGWTVVRDMQLATQKTGTALRRQVESIQNLQSSKNYEFRLWLLYEHSALNNSSAAAHLLALLRTERFFFEYPSTLAEYYNFFRKKYEQVGPRLARTRDQSEVASSRRLGSFAEPSTSTSIHLEKAHSWIQNALLVFHSLFSRHLQTVRIQNENQHSNCLTPTDMMISYFEFERASRLLQMHMKQRIMATKLASSSSTVMNVAAALASEWQTLVNLASLVYMNRQWSPLHSSQCRELLTWCFQTQVNTHEQPPVLGGNKDILAKRRSQVGKLREQMNSSARAMINQENTEMQFIPPSRQHQLDAVGRWHVVRSLRKIYSAHNEDCSYSAAQQALKALAEQLPNAFSLSKHVHMQRKDRHASIIESWKKPKGGMCALVGPKQDKHSSWKQALLTHLMQTEIPALETYLSHIWSSIEIVLSLNAESLDSIRANQGSTASPFHRDVGDILQSISRQDVPKSWTACTPQPKQQHRQRCQGYSFSRRLMCWLAWLRRAVGFYQGLHNSTTLTPRLPDFIYLPALHHPDAFLFAFVHSVSVANDIPFQELALVVHATRLPPDTESPGGEESGASISEPFALERLPSLVLSGLCIAHAKWSFELGVVVETESESAATPLLSLPALSVQVTTRFQSQAGFNGHDDQDDADSLFYRCPLFASPAQFALLEQPMAFVHLPTDQAARLLTSSSVAMFLTEAP